MTAKCWNTHFLVAAYIIFFNYFAFVILVYNKFHTKCYQNMPVLIIVYDYFWGTWNWIPFIIINTVEHINENSLLLVIIWQLPEEFCIYSMVFWNMCKRMWKKDLETGRSTCKIYTTTYSTHPVRGCGRKSVVFIAGSETALLTWRCTASTGRLATAA